MKGKDKDDIYIEPHLSRQVSPPSLKSLLSNPSLYEETTMEEPTASDFSSLEDLLGEEAM